MTFEKIIEQVTSSANSSKNFLTDGLLTCYYSQIPTVFESLDQYFLTKEIQLDHGLALEGLNTVPGALILLYLLKKNYSFIFLPHRDKTPGLKPVLPIFCQYRLIVKGPATLAAGEWQQQLDNCFEIEQHEQYQGEQTPTGHGRGKLYLRTSGSMGTSKIVVHSQLKLLGNARNCVNRFQLQADDRVFLPVPIFHMYGLGAGFLPATMVGASLDLQEQSNILKYLERERLFNPNVAFLTPLLCDMLVQGRRISRPYKLVVTAGDKIKEDLFRAFDARFGPLVNLYGSTEMGAVAACELTDAVGVRATTNKLMAEVQMKLDDDSDDPEETRIGELYCKHEYGFEEYLDEQGKKIIPSLPLEWFQTGDLGKLLPNGYIHVLGRCDHSVNRSGFLVLFTDIEKAMEKIEAVTKVVVVAVTGEEKRGQRIAAFCVLSPGATMDDTKIREACFDFLPKYAIPDQVLIVNELPTLPSGKLDRQALVKMTG